MMFIRNFLLLTIFVSLFTLPACEKEKKGKGREVKFNYQKILKREYRKNVGKVIPVTIEQAIEIDGIFTRDGSHFFYASDRDRGNYDIYLRTLTDITTVRITRHPSKDTSPSISPDGKYLAFVSQREDPEGDIYLVKINPAKIIERAKESITEIPSLDKDAKNLTQYQDPGTKTVKIIKDASPCWSPDGKSIVFSSNRGGSENIWITDIKGKKLRGITKKGGMYPRFSEDGQYIVFISYRDKGKNGEVYTVNVKSGRERRITRTDGIELYPTFMGNSHEIVYTLIDRDTNANEKFDLGDNSILYYKNLKSGLEYPLTLYSQSSFSPKWSPVYKAHDRSYMGVIVYSDQVEQNININIIPEYGVIPKKKNARRQFDLAVKYLQEFDDIERYVLCLERVHHFFGRSKSRESIIYVSKSLIEAARLYNEFGYKREASNIQALLSSLSGDKSDYRSIAADYLKIVFSGNRGDGVIKNAIEKVKGYRDKTEFVPYLMEDLGDEYVRSGNFQRAVDVFRKLLNEYPKYRRSVYIDHKIGKLSYTTLKDTISPSYLRVLQSTYDYLKNDTVIDLLAVFRGEMSIKRRITISQNMLKRYSDNRYLPGLLHYVIGESYKELGDPASAKKHLKESLKLVKKSDLIFYRSNILLGSIAEMEKRISDMEKHYAPAANNYLLKWKQKDIRKVSKKLINYYEEYGKRAEVAGDYQGAVQLYKKYVRLIGYLHLQKIFEDIYNEYGSRANVLYVNAYSELKGNNIENLNILERQYLKRLPIARLDFDKAHIYGLGYIYTKMALIMDRKDPSSPLGNIEGALSSFRRGIEQVEWALFIDDTFIDPYLLKGWIYQYVDLKRKEDLKRTGGSGERKIGKFFPKFLWESNISLYEKALNANDEVKNPETEGNLYLNIANTYFLLNNYPRALSNYKLVGKYKKGFNTNIEEALFHFHFGYCYWQNNEIDRARDEMDKTLFIYTLASGKSLRRYRFQIYNIYRYFALFDRAERRYQEAIDWYNRILDFTHDNSIDVDRARYLQEIAYCYKELGNIDEALVYLNRAQKRLRNYPDTEKKYPLKLNIFGFLPVTVLNLGPDAAVIGENKLYTELDTYNKKLLNISLQEDIFFNASNYAKAIEYQEKKLELLEERDYKVNREGIIRTLNNIGYCYFKLRNYKEAGDYFKRAWDFAADPDVNDLNGIFKSIMNVTNLLIFSIENNINLSNNPLKDADVLIKKISKYRDGYEKNRFNIEMENLKEEAKAQKRELKHEEIVKLGERITNTARDIYYTLDIAIGVLKYYKAEILYRGEVEFKGEGINIAYNLYKENKRIYDLYSDSRYRFENALNKAENLQSKRLLVKLLLNLGSCQKRTAYIDEAYQSFSNAEKIARKYKYHKILWEVYFTIAGFIYEYGDIVEGKGYLSISEEYYKRATDIIERSPTLYAGDTYRVKRLYDEYIRLLLRRGKQKRALQISEKKYKTVRSTIISASSPNFFDEEDRRDYKYVKDYLREIDRAQKSITSLLESGEPAESKKFISLRDKIKTGYNHINTVKNRLKKRRSLLYSYFSTKSSEVPKYKGIVIYKFLSLNGKTYAWKISAGKINFKPLKNGNASPDTAITDYLENDKKHLGKRYIVLNETLLSYIQKNIDKKPPFPFMCVPSIDRVKYYLSYKNLNLENIYFSETGLKSELSGNKTLKNIKIVEGDEGKFDYSDFSVIIDAKAAGRITPSVLFAKRLEPSLLIKRIDDYNIDYLYLLIESSLYSGVRTLILYRDLKTAGLKSLLGNAYSKSYDYINSEFAFTGKVIGIGFAGYAKSLRESKMSIEEDKLLSRYRSELMTGNLQLAKMYLNRWYETGLTSKKQPAYLLNIAEIEYLNENLDRAFDSLRRAIELSKKSNSDIYLQAISNQIYLKLYSGRIIQAGTLLSSYGKNPKFRRSKDFLIFRSITDLLSKGIKNSIEYYNNSKGIRFSILPENRLKLLYAEYLNLFGYNNYIKAVLSDWKHDYPLSSREALKVVISKRGKSGVKLLSDRSKSIADLMDSSGDMERLKNRSVLSVVQQGRYDSLSPFSISLPLFNFIKRNRYDIAFSLIGQIDLDEIVKNSDWKDAIPLLSTINEIHTSNGRYGESVKVIEIFIKLLKNRELPSLLKNILYKHGITLLKIRNYKKSYEVANRGYRLTKEGDELYLKYQLLLMENEVFLGRIENAIERGQKIESKLKDEYLYVLYLLRANIVRHNIIKSKKAGKSELDSYEKLVIRAINTLDKSPDLLQRFNRIDLIKRGVDFIISYELSRRNSLKALIFSEIRKQLIIRSKFPRIIYTGNLPPAAINEFRDIKNGVAGQKRFAALLRRYPLLHVGATINTIPIKLFQRLIPKNAVTLYIIVNENDIFSWVIDRSRIVSLRFKNGYSRIKRIISKYDSASSQLVNTINISKELYNLFKPLEKFYKGKKMIVIISDDDLESVPFEIIGKREMLDESHTIVYLSSILSALRNYNSGNRVVNLIDTESKRIYHELEIIALRESGIAYRLSDLINSGMGHIHGSISFNPVKGEFFLKETRYIKIIKSPEIVYLPSVNFIEQRGYNDFTLFSSFRGIRAVIINDAKIHDVNNAIFVDNFYREIKKGRGFIKAFEGAKHSIRDSERYKHPAYWAGIRLYLNGF